jgi:hypothetical protein
MIRNYSLAPAGNTGIAGLGLDSATPTISTVYIGSFNCNLTGCTTDLTVSQL